MVDKYGVKTPNVMSEELKKLYGGARIFHDFASLSLSSEEQYEPIVVNLSDEEIVVSKDEAELLALGPKFCIRNKLCEETFKCEVEECIMKMRWDMMGEDLKGKNDKNEDPAYKNIELFFTEEENTKINEEIEEEQRLEDAKTRMIFDHIGLKMDLSNRITTDLKGNARVVFPRKSRGFDVEAKLETFRVEVMAEFRNFLREKCDVKGTQSSNLSKSQARGLKSLLTRVKNGEIVVTPTDKSGNFAVMSRKSYEEAGLKHVKNDVPVEWDELKRAQSELNGHVAMMAKIFEIGKAWNHQDRIRETMLGKGLSVCPVSLLLKDHKGWSPSSGTVPPTRHVAGGHVGMNFHLSEINSDILEPLVENFKGGKEAISTEDMLAKVELMTVSAIQEHDQIPHF